MAATQPPHRRLVLDTNVVIAGLLWNGPSRQLLEGAMRGAFELFSSPALLMELARTLAYPKFTKRLAVGATTAELLLLQYRALVTLVEPVSVPKVVPVDPADDHVLAAAVAARADWLVTGDRRHLLPIGAHDGIAIVDAATVLAMLQTQLGGQATEAPAS